MATEHSPDAGAAKGLTRRAVDTAKTAFDASEPTSRRVRAGAVIAGSLSAAVVGSVVGVDVVQTLDPGILHGLAPYEAATWITAISAVSTGAVVSGIGGIAINDADEYWHPGRKMVYRGRMHSMFAHSRTASFVVGGAFALMAAGFEVPHLLHVGGEMTGVVHGFGDVAAVFGVTGLTAHAGAKAWSHGLPKPQQQHQLSE